MRALVTGGAGFIVGHVTEQQTKAGHDVTVLDNFVPYYDLGIKEHNVEATREAAETNDGGYTLVEGSVTDAELVADVDVVYHQAAHAGAPKSVDEPKTVNHYNVDSTVEVPDAARNHDVDRPVGRHPVLDLLFGSHRGI